MVDIARDARWGRVVEGAGEDTYLGSEIAKARVNGFQWNLWENNSVLACAKHWVAYGLPQAGRDYAPVDMSERTLFRHFDRMFGMSPNNYLRKIRIQKAEELLRKTHYEINEIAVKCGFCDSSHFCRVFHSVTGETPLQFRSGYQRKDFLVRSE